MEIDMVPTFTDKAFDFYGTYVRINEPQKYKYAETELIRFHEDLIQQLFTKINLQNMEVDQMAKLNKSYLEDRQRFEKMIIKAKADNDKLERTMLH